MNVKLLKAAAELAAILDNEYIKDHCTFESVSESIHDYSVKLDSLYLVHRSTGEKIKVLELEYEDA